MNNLDLKKEYYYLYVLSQTFRIIGYLLLIAALALLIIGLIKVDLNNMIDSYLFFLSSIVTIILAIIHFALPEVIKVFVRIEFNTRKDAPNLKA